MPIPIPVLGLGLAIPELFLNAADNRHNPDFSKDFLVYTFASDHSLATVLTQKDEKGVCLVVIMHVIPLSNERLVVTTGFRVIECREFFFVINSGYPWILVCEKTYLMLCVIFVFARALWQIKMEMLMIFWCGEAHSTRLSLIYNGEEYTMMKSITRIGKKCVHKALMVCPAKYRP